MKSNIELAKVALGSPVVYEERLPYPFVYYPEHYGTFFAFAKDENSEVVMCSCSKSAIENYLQLRSMEELGKNADVLRMAPLCSLYFPKLIAEISLKSPKYPLSEITFVDGICHRCTLVPPTLRYCLEMYGGRFIQQFGWYYNQQFLKLGIKDHYARLFLPNVCPLEYQQDILSIKKADQEFSIESERINNMVLGPKRKDIPSDEIVYMANVRMDEAQEMIRLRRLASQTRRAFTKKIENTVRQEFGFKKVGEGWVSETLLYQIIKNILPQFEMVRHHRPKWLEGLELDIFIPDLKLGFEYQGQQHFHPIKAWGGKESLKKLKERDKKKVKLCEQNNITLIEVLYFEPLTESHIKELLLKNGFS